MYIMLILFFVSLLGIVFMLGRKLVLANNGTINDVEKLHPFAIDLRKIKSFGWRKIRIAGYATLVLGVRAYVNISEFTKQSYGKVKLVVENKLSKSKMLLDKSQESPEVSSFLQRITEYKQKIGVIKDKIEREKGL